MWRALMILVGVVAAGCMGAIESSDLAPPTTEPNLGCALGCHGTDTSNAPPTSTHGATATTEVGVGAHRAHLGKASVWHRTVACADCHVVPETSGAPGHIDGDGQAEVTFGPVGTPGTWSGTTCTTRCHGQTAWGGTQPAPTWTRVDGTQATCGSCHGAPPPAPHPADMNCAACHPTMEEGALSFRDPESHINGVVDVVGAGATGGCTSCHGSTNAAPPRDLSGDTARTAAGVGAHQQHLAASTWHRSVTCSSCHLVPTTANAPGHQDGDNVAEVTFDALNPVGAYAAATTTCSSQYCHGNGRGNNGTISWLRSGALPCTGCHQTSGTGMSGDHRRHIGEENMTCNECHADVIDAGMTIIAPTLHIDGAHQVRMANGTFNAGTRQCSNTQCHGVETW